MPSSTSPPTDSFFNCTAVCAIASSASQGASPTFTSAQRRPRRQRPPRRYHGYRAAVLPKAPAPTSAHCVHGAPKTQLGTAERIHHATLCAHASHTLATHHGSCCVGSYDPSRRHQATRAHHTRTAAATVRAIATYIPEPKMPPLSVMPAPFFSGQLPHFVRTACGAIPPSPHFQPLLHALD